MDTWHLGSPKAIGNMQLSSAAFLLESARAGDPRSWLNFLGDIAPIDYLCVVEYVSRAHESGAATPELVGGISSPGLANVTRECFSLYLKSFWRIDEATPYAQHGGDPGKDILAMRMRRNDIRDASWKREIYDRRQLEERLTLLYSPVRGSTFAMNLYRSERRGFFQEHEVHALMEAAPLVRLAHSVAISQRSKTNAVIEERIADAAWKLERCVPGLSAREQAVSARIACGITADGIAADLGIARTTVATLRKRAYQKLSDRGMVPGRDQLAKLVA